MYDYNLHRKVLKEVEAGRVSQQTTGLLSIFKYARTVHLNGEWNDINRQCRGLIISHDSRIVARPFPKFFNLGEVTETKLENLPQIPYVVEEKLDGSCGIGYHYNDKWRLATPGSMESDQAQRGTTILEKYNVNDIPHYCTPIFEIIYPENRIVIDYEGDEGLTLLTVFNHFGSEWTRHGVNSLAEHCGFKRPLVYDDVDINDIAFPKELREGYVIRYDNAPGETAFRVKVKDPRYVRIHRLLEFLSPKGVVDLLSGGEYRAILLSLPKEIQKDFDDIRSTLVQERATLEKQVDQWYDDLILSGTKNRKDAAHWIMTHVEGPYRWLVFNKLDDKMPPEDKVWKLVLGRV